jgi:hypothetical protein
MDFSIAITEAYRIVCRDSIWDLTRVTLRRRNWVEDGGCPEMEN